jgi:hypothetical protein
MTLNEIQHIYGAKLGKRQILSKWINNPICQNYIKKALEYKLTDSDADHLFKIGSWKSNQFPGLYYLCLIYIHPLTKLQGICQKLEKIGRL